MNLRQLMHDYNLRPDKSLGQHFLVDQGALGKVIQAADLKPGAHVLEVGAGLGVLTLRLAEICEQVLAVEIDTRLRPALLDVLEPYDNVRVVFGDILELPWERLSLPDPYQVVANIPYNITSALIRRLLEAPNAPTSLTLTIQREVADRIIAQPGAMSLLSVSVQLYGNPQRVARIPAGAFYPAPEVESAVLRIDLHPRPLLPEAWLTPFFRLVKAGFSQRRKKLRNSLAAGMAVETAQVEDWLRQAGISAHHRAQKLTLNDWIAITAVVLGDDISSAGM